MQPSNQLCCHHNLLTACCHISLSLISLPILMSNKSFDRMHNCPYMQQSNHKYKNPYVIPWMHINEGRIVLALPSPSTYLLKHLSATPLPTLPSFTYFGKYFVSDNSLLFIANNFFIFTTFFHETIPIHFTSLIHCSLTVTRSYFNIYHLNLSSILPS